MARGSTVYPQAIGVASTWEPEPCTRAGRCGPRADAGDGRPPGPVAGARHLPRSALGPHRGDLRRGPVPRRAHGGRVRARAAGRRPARGRRGDREAPRRLRRVRGRHELGPGAHRRVRAARRVPAPVRGHRARRGPALGDERVQRDRRDAVRRRSRAADRAPARPLGVRRIGRLRLLRGAPDRDVPPARRGRPARRRAGARRGHRRRAAGHRLLRRARCWRPSAAGSWRRRSSTRRYAGCSPPSSSWACSSDRSSTWRRSPTRSAWTRSAPSPGRSRARASCC